LPWSPIRRRIRPGPGTSFRKGQWRSGCMSNRRKGAAVSDPLTLDVQPTPNVNALKFVLNRRMTEGRSQTFTDPNTAGSALARDLLLISGVRQVFFLNDFITVTRLDGADWDTLVPRVEEAIRRNLSMEA